MPSLGPWVSPRNTAEGLIGEKGVSHAQIMTGAQLQQPLSIVVHGAHPVMTNDGRPCLMVCSNTGVEVTKDEDAV